MITDDISTSELRYRRLFEAAHDGILIIDPESRQIVDVNPFLVNFLGYTKDEIIGKELYEIGLLKDEEASQAAFCELRVNGYIRYEDLPLETKKGQKVDVEFVSNLYQEGERQIIQCNIRDISARKLAELALRQSEERFKLVAQLVSDVIWDWNLVADKVWWSGGGGAFGADEVELEPGIEEWQKRIHPDDRRRVISVIRQSIDTNMESWAVGFRFKYKDDNYTFMQGNGYLLRNTAGKVVQMMGSLRDLTEEKKMAEQHLRAERMESIGTLAGGIAHDLNNVLTPILMSIELLRGGENNSPDHNTILDTINVSCRRGADLVRQVLLFARGVDSLQISIRLKHLVDELKGLITETFPRNIKIVTQIPSDLWPVMGNPTQLHQVLLNLAVNARDAMPSGGIFSLTMSNIDLDEKNPCVGQENRSGRHVLIQVRDTGLGIDPEIRAHIFEPFFTTKEAGKGTGFGLATVNTVVKSHGGFLNVESEMGKGSTFDIYLPADPDARVISSAPPFQAGLPRGKDELALVVDDELSIRDITQRILESFGYRVITAKNGAEAVEIYTKEMAKISIIITDMMMPVMDGAQAVPLFRSINPSAKIIVCSGLEVPQEIQATVHGCVAKPYTAHTLIRMVRDVLDSVAVTAS